MDVDIGFIYTHERHLMGPLVSSLAQSGQGVSMRLILVDNASADGVTEIRAGVYMAGDLVQSVLETLPLQRVAFSVLATVIAHQRRKAERIGQCQRMVKLPGEFQCFGHVGEGLIGIPQHPRRPREVHAVRDTRILAGAQGERAMLGNIVNADAGLGVDTTRFVVALQKGARGHGSMREEQEGRVGRFVRNLQQLLPQLARGGQHAADFGEDRGIGKEVPLDAGLGTRWKRGADEQQGGKNRFHERELSRAVRALERAGKTVDRVEIGDDGRVAVIVAKPGDKQESEQNLTDLV